MYLNFGTPKNNEFSISGVPILKHIRVVIHTYISNKHHISVALDPHRMLK